MESKLAVTPCLTYTIPLFQKSHTQRGWRPWQNPLTEVMRGALYRIFGELDLPVRYRYTTAVATLPVLTAAAGQQTLWHPIRDADRLAAYRAAVGPLPAWWDRCVATAPARVCPCGSYRLCWGEDELCRESGK